MGECTSWGVNMVRLSSSSPQMRTHGWAWCEQVGPLRAPKCRCCLAARQKCRIWLNSVAGDLRLGQGLWRLLHLQQEMPVVKQVLPLYPQYSLGQGGEAVAMEIRVLVTPRLQWRQQAHLRSHQITKLQPAWPAWCPASPTATVLLPQSPQHWHLLMQDPHPSLHFPACLPCLLCPHSLLYQFLLQSPPFLLFLLFRHCPKDLQCLLCHTFRTCPPYLPSTLPYLPQLD